MHWFYAHSHPQYMEMLPLKEDEMRNFCAIQKVRKFAIDGCSMSLQILNTKECSYENEACCIVHIKISVSGKL